MSPADRQWARESRHEAAVLRAGHVAAHLLAYVVLLMLSAVLPLAWYRTGNDTYLTVFCVVFLIAAAAWMRSTDRPSDEEPGTTGGAR